MFIGSLCVFVFLCGEKKARVATFSLGAPLFDVMSTCIVWCMFAREIVAVITV